MAGSPELVRGCAQILADAVQAVGANLAHLGDAFPADTTDAGSYPLRPATDRTPLGGNTGWTTAFWTGELWLSWEQSGDARFERAALQHVASFADRVAADVDCDHHDLGFLYTLSCVAGWRLTGSDAGRQAALAAADRLMDRFLEPAGVFQAWGDLVDPRQRGRVIIDSLMNMPLLYWASEQTGDPRFAEAAHRHARRLHENIVRPDGSSFHTFYFDPETGAALRGDTAQGYSDHSCWARGQAWGILGFLLNYSATKDPDLLAAARRLAAYFLDHLPGDKVVYWDLSFADGSGQFRDSSAAAIACCGLLELARHGDPDGRYAAAVQEIIASLARSYAPEEPRAGEPLLRHAVYNLPNGEGVDEGCLWGDYFYLEALTRLSRPDWHPYW